MAEKENKIRFGLENVHIAKIEGVTADFKYTYATPKHIPGGISIDLAAQGDSAEHYADNILYYFLDNNTGYQGDLNITAIPNWFLVDILKEAIDKAGVQWESSDAVPEEFAMGFEISGDVTHTRFWFLRNKITRPNVHGQTTEKTKTPVTDSMTLTAMPREGDHFVKGFATQDSTKYATWFDAVVEPEFEETQVASEQASESETDNQVSEPETTG